MVTVALEMHITVRKGGCPQTAGAGCPLSLSTGTAHSVPHLVSPPPSAPLPVCGMGLSPAGAGEDKDSGCSHLFPVELMADDGSGGAGCQWEAGMGHQQDGFLELGGMHSTSLTAKQTPGRNRRSL